MEAEAFSTFFIANQEYANKVIPFFSYSLKDIHIDSLSSERKDDNKTKRRGFRKKK